MSIKRMTAVWEKSQHKGGELLCLLAIADFATDDGVAWPGIETIAEKTRLTPRHTRRMIKSLCDSGELWKSRVAAGEHNIYVILLALTKLELANARAHVTAVVGEDILAPIGDDALPVALYGEDILSSHGRTPTPSDSGQKSPDTKDAHTPRSVTDPSLDPKPAPSKERKPLGAKLLQATLTVPEGEHVRSSLAEYIGQEMGSRVPSGQCKQLAMTYTEQTTNGPFRHPSPDDLWESNFPGYRDYVAERVEFYKGISATPARKRQRLVSRLSNYKSPDGYGWLDRKGKVDQRVWVDA